MSCPDIPNIRHLRMVQMIGHLNGVSGAARHLNAAQPTVTQAVAKLEALIGTPIFIRSATGSFPTDAGAMFIRRIDRFFDILEDAIFGVIGRRQDPHGRQLPLVERLVSTTQLRSLVVTSDPAMVQAEARELGVSPASLYRSARALEASLGQTLFETSIEGPVCNELGQSLAREVLKAIREIEYALAELASYQGMAGMVIVIGVPPLSGAFGLANAMRAFTKLYPAIDIKIVSDSYDVMLNQLLNCRIDIMYGLLRKPPWNLDLVEEPLFYDSYCVVMRPGHPLCDLAEITPHALLDYDWVIPAKGTPRRDNIDRIFDEIDGEPRRNIESSSLAYARALLVASDMITVMARSEARLDESLGNMVCRPCQGLDAVTSKGITTRKNWLPTVAHKQFLQCLRDATSKESP